MVLMPRQTRYRKVQRGKSRGLAQRGNQLNFGDFGLQALSGCWMSAVQVESARVAINRNLKRKGKVWVRVFPHKPVTKRPPETRMGKGKGNPEFWVDVVKAGKVLFEVEGVGAALAKEALRKAANKLPIRTRLVTRH